MTTLVGGRLAGREPTEADVEPLTWAMWERAREPGHDRATSSAQGRLERVARAIVRGFSAFDAVLTPALAQRPCRSARSTAAGPTRGSNYRRSGHFTPYTAIVNVTGLPAISLPLYHGDDGLPTACS